MPAFGSSLKRNPLLGTLRGLTPARLSQFLAEYYQGNFRNIAAVWETIQRRDDTIKTVDPKRKSKIARNISNLRVTPVDDTPRAQQHADFLREFYASLTASSEGLPGVRGGLHQAVKLICDALPKQYSFLAKEWDNSSGRVRLHLRHVPLWYFKLDDKTGEFRFVAAEGLGEPVTPEQWLICARDSAIMEAACVMWLMKRLPMQQTAHILEKWGVPSVIGKTKEGKDTDGYANLKAAVQAHLSGFSAVISGDGEIDSLEAKSSASLGHLQMKWIPFCRDTIISLFLGGNLSTSSQSGTGALAGGAQADDTDEMIDDDCIWLTDLFGEQISREALCYQFGDTEPLATVTISRPDNVDDKGDLDILTKLVANGLPVGVDYAYDRFRVPRPDADEQLLTPESSSSLTSLAGFNSLPAGHSQAAGNRPASRLRTARNATAPRALTARISADLDSVAASAAAPIGNAIATLIEPLAATIDAGRELDTAPALDPAPLAAVVAPAIFAAVMRGYEDDRQYLPARNSLAQEGCSRPGFFRSFIRRLTSRNAVNTDASPTALPFDEALAYWSAKKLVVDIADIADFTWQETNALSFRVAQLAEEAAIREAKRVIGNVISGDIAWGEAATQLREKFSLGKFYSELVVRNNVQSAYSWGHWQQLSQVASELGWLAFDVVEDDNTSEICAPLAGQAYPHDSPVWGTLYPPNHHNCRTTVFALAPEEVEGYGFTARTGTPRDERGAEIIAARGFAYNVGQQPLSRVLDTKES